jgi:prepilin-type N-terminal cleavage/methylation domain-containing protein
MEYARHELRIRSVHLKRSTGAVIVRARSPLLLSRQSPRHRKHPQEPSIMKRPLPSRRQRGFTLVEIAIVLMIVGLLIGGILRGQELIQSARVRNIIDQKSGIQTAYIGFMDRYRMLPGDLTATQATTVGNGVLWSGAGGNGQIAFDTESTLLFQNLTAAGFISCGACMTVTLAGGGGTGPLPVIGNSPVNVYGELLVIGNLLSSNTGGNWFDAVANINRLALYTGASIPSQVLAEVDRKADDGLPGTGQLRGAFGGGAGLALCTPGLATATATTATWANPSQSNCMGGWLF